MLIGGFQKFDIANALKENAGNKFSLPFDVSGCYDRQIFTNNGRTATVYLLENCIQLAPDDYLLLPDYLCLSIIVAVEAGHAPYQFYKVNRDLSVDLEDLRSKALGHGKRKCRGIYLTHFFGEAYPDDVTNTIIELSKELDIPIIEDITQALLTTPYDGHKGIGFGDYLVASTRKWFPNSDGGILWARQGVPLPDVPLGDPYNEAAYKQLMISLIRDWYDSNAFDDGLASYVDYEREANRVRYIDLSPRDMTPFSKNIMLNSDLTEIAAIRQQNYMHLFNGITSIRSDAIQILSTNIEPTIGGPKSFGIVPFGLVILSEQRDELYNYLAKKGIVGEIQWILPVEYYEPGDDAIWLSNHNIMLQCDQRYTIKEMDIVLDALASFDS